MQTLSRKFFVVSAAICASAIAGIAYSAISSDTQASSKNAAAVVNGHVISMAEIDAAVQRGIDRPNALDIAVNRAVFASAAQNEFRDKAAAAVEMATREVLAQTYLSESAKKINDALTEQQLSDWYAKKVLDTDYRQLKVRYVMTANPDAAKIAFDNAVTGDFKGFEPLSKDGDGFMPAQQVPYNLGPDLAKLKAGDVTGPLLVREGYLVAVLDAARDGKKPSFEASKESIRQILVQETLSNTLKDLRAKSVITLK